MMRNTIMTEKIVRRGVRVPLEYSVDFLQRMLVGQVYNRDVVTLKAEDTLERVQQWIQQGGPDTRHHGYPIVDRSEEHTSELQSLMRITYAVFCLKKKTEPKNN